MAKRYYHGPVSDHFDGQRFYHPGLPSTDKRVSDLLRWKLKGNASSWPKVVPARSGLKPDRGVPRLRITFVGHASLLIQVNGTNLLVDPVWSERASPFSWAGPRRRNAPAVAFADLPPIHVVLLTHNHYDHLDLRTLAALRRAHSPLILAPLGNDAVIRPALPSIEMTTGDWWQTFSLGNEIRAIIVPSYHWSSRNLGDFRMALWGGFVLQTPAGTVYCAGDTAYRDSAVFREIGTRFGPPLVAVLPIGAYAPRWFMKTQHAEPEETLQIAQDCGAKTVLGVHWGTFPLTDEPYEEPALRFEAALRSQAAGMHGQALRPGNIWESGR